MSNCGNQSNINNDNNKSKNNDKRSTQRRRSVRRVASMIFNRGGNLNKSSSSESARNMNSGTNTHSSNYRGRNDTTSPGSTRESVQQLRMGNSNLNNTTRTNNNNNKRTTNTNSAATAATARSTRKSPENIRRHSNNYNNNHGNHYRKTSPRKSPVHHHDRVIVESTPIGLNGPTQFEFSPSVVIHPQKKQQKQNEQQHMNEHPSEQRYLSFLSSHTLPSPPPNPSSTSSPFSITGSPVRTMASGGATGTGGGYTSSEKRLCVLDLRPFYKTIDLANEQRVKQQRGQSHSQHQRQRQRQRSRDKGIIIERQTDHEKMNADSFHNTEDINNYNIHKNIDDDDNNIMFHGLKKMIEPITDPNLLMNDHVSHLLNTSQPLNRTNDYHYNNQTHPHSPTSPYVSPNNKSSRAISPVTSMDTRNSNRTLELNEKMSLEERLRRERQRLHSNGITQFGWISLEDDSNTTSAATITANTTATANNNFNIPSKSNRPTPERIDESIETNSNIRYKRVKSKTNKDSIRILVPLRGNIYIQDGVGFNVSSPLRLLYDKTMLEDYISYKTQGKKKKRGNKKSSSRNHGKRNSVGTTNYNNSSIVGRDAGAIDPQLSPDGTMVAFVVAGEMYVMSCGDKFTTTNLYSNVDGDGDYDMYDEDGRNDFDCKRDTNGDGNNNGNNENEADDEIVIDTMNINEESSQFTDFAEQRKPRRVTFGAMIDSSGRYDEFDDDDDEDNTDGDSSSSGDRDNSSARKKRYGRSITHGLADFVAQEEMDRYRGFWWDEESNGILFVKVDESCVPPYRITHQGNDGVPGEDANYEDHRYPFAGENNPDVSLGYVPINRELILLGYQSNITENGNREDLVEMNDKGVNEVEAGIEDEYSQYMWSQVKWFHPPPEASEYLARVNWLPCGSACIQWQDRLQSKLVLSKIDIHSGESVILHKEESNVWINLHHMFHVLPKPIHPSECLRQDWNRESKPKPLRKGSFSFLFASERTGYCHLYLYTYIPGDLGATLLRAVSSGEWIVESIVGVDIENDAVYVSGTYDSPLERHLYMLPLKRKNLMKKSETGSGGVLGVRKGFKQVLNTFSNTSKRQSISSYEHSPPVNTDSPPNPIRLTDEPGMHSVVMDKNCRLFVDTCSDLNRPPSSKVFSIADVQIGETNLLFVLYDASKDLQSDNITLPPPELLSITTSDGSEKLHAALYTPDPLVHGSGPYPLICAVYGGPHVQRVNRSWNQCVDMRAQRLTSLGFAVVKCDNRGSSRRGLAFEAAIKNNMGRIEVLDQVAVVRNLIMKRIADPNNVGIYGWSYGGYLAAMCLCRAPDVFKVAIAGAPVTSWDGYDTHYTERYMGLPKENSSGYHESAVFNHIQNMRGKLMIIHGLIDENVHFRHTARLINRLVSCGKDYDLLIFPDERHSPRRLRDRVYMEKRMNEYFVENLLGDSNNNNPHEYLLGHL